MNLEKQVISKYRTNRKISYFFMSISTVLIRFLKTYKIKKKKNNNMKKE